MAKQQSKKETTKEQRVQYVLKLRASQEEKQYKKTYLCLELYNRNIVL